MQTLRKNSQHPNVLRWQSFLFDLEYLNQTPSGVFDESTVKATKLFQAANGLKPDSIVGGVTWGLIELQSYLLKYSDYESASKRLGCRIESILAVSKVESPGSGFFPDGRPRILFEGHIFYDRLEEAGLDPEAYRKEFPDLIYPKWDKTHYKGYGKPKTINIDDEYERLNIARTIHEQAALKSASWGKYQIMGFNHECCGYGRLIDFLYDIQISESNHLEMFVEFIIYKGLKESLINGRWAEFAKGYNGSQYKLNRYDVIIGEAFDLFDSLKLI